MDAVYELPGVAAGVLVLLLPFAKGMYPQTADPLRAMLDAELFGGLFSS